MKLHVTCFVLVLLFMLVHTLTAFRRKPELKQGLIQPSQQTPGTAEESPATPSSQASPGLAENSTDMTLDKVSAVLSILHSKLILAAANKHIVIIILEAIGSVLTVILIILGVIFVVLCLTPIWLGPALKMAIEEIDEEYLGVQIKVGKIRVNPFVGWVRIDDLKVQNPKGYNAEHMLTVGKAAVTLKIFDLLRSVMRTKTSRTRKGKVLRVIVKHIVFRDIQATVEKHSVFTSNVKEVLNHLESAREEPEDEEDDDEPVQNANDSRPKPKPRITVQAVKMLNIDVRFQVEGNVINWGSVGCHLAVADIVEEHFSRNHKNCLVKDLIVEILKTVLKSVVTSVAGKKAGGHVF